MTMQTHQSTSANQTKVSQTCKLWITDDYFLRIDEHGYVEGQCYEGALGCVIKLSSDSAIRDVALKIPRLLAETPSQNAYICTIVAQESREVGQVNKNKPQTAALISAASLPSDCLCGPRLFRNGHSDKNAQKNGYIFVSFQKGKNPRFCNVKYDDRSKKCIFFPPNIAPDLGLLINADTWVKIQSESKLGESEFSNPICFSTASSSADSSSIGVCNLNKSLGTQSSKSFWFGAIPAITYEWASGQLQNLIALRQHITWKIQDHYQLVINMLEAVVWLHKSDKLHGDIRPANIMAIGDKSLAKNYALGDYGSFSNGQTPMHSDDRARSGQTTMGPGINKLRTSIFYAPERRGSQELESGNVAIILSTFSSSTEVQPKISEFCIYLTWRSELFDEAGIIKAPVLDRVKGLWKSRHKDGQSQLNTRARLQSGDRIRLRDYIFNVKSCDKSDPNIIYCDRRYSQVFHEQIEIYQEQPIPDQTIVNLDRYTELYQWSVATDLYGIGALSLYLIYTAAAATHDHSKTSHGKKTATKENSGRTRKFDELIGNELTAHNAVDTESTVASMLRMLEDVTFFNYIWKDIHPFQLKLIELEQSKDHENALPSIIIPLESNHEASLKEIGLQVSNSLLSLIPSFRCVLHFFGYNTADFLLFVHFLLSCIKRSDELDDANRPVSTLLTAGSSNFPFCKSRLEKKKDSKAAELALTQLSSLKRFQESGRHIGFVEDPGKFDDADIGSEFATKIELRDIRLAMKKVRECIQSASHSLQSIKDNFEIGWLQRTVFSKSITLEMRNKTSLISEHFQTIMKALG